MTTHCADAGRDEGAAYARALLERIAAGSAAPGDLAGLCEFLKTGPMLEGACAVLFDALRSGPRREAP